MLGTGLESQSNRSWYERQLLSVARFLNMSEYLFPSFKYDALPLDSSEHLLICWCAIVIPILC